VRLGVFFPRKSPNPNGCQEVKKLAQKYNLASLFGAKSVVKIDYYNAAFISSASAKV